MKAKSLFLLFIILSHYTGFSQDSLNVESKSIVVKDTTTEKSDTPTDTLIYSPYRIKSKVDIPIPVIGLATNYLGLRALRSNKPGDKEVLDLTPDDVQWAFEKGAAEQDPGYAPTANILADIGLIGSFAAPGFLYFNQRVRKDVFKVLIMHLETQAIMGNMYFLTMMISKRRRPYVYNINESEERRTRRGNNNSFYSGHVAHAASSSFFIAKVLDDYYPERNWEHWLYPSALVPPALIGYFRYKGGQHFITDIVVGTAIGAGVGWLIPFLHRPRKKENRKKLVVSPFYNGPASGLSFNYRF